MRTADTLTLDAVSAATTQTGAAIPCERLSHASAVITVAGVTGQTNPSATITLQGSNDAPPGLSPFVPTNWANIAGASVTVDGDGTAALPVTPICFRFIRLVYTYASGTGGTLSARVHAQGWQ